MLFPAGPAKKPAEKIVKNIRRITRRKFSAEEKIRIVLDDLRGEHSIVESCRREGIAEVLHLVEGRISESAGRGGGNSALLPPDDAPPQPHLKRARARR
jgi:transposase-like protein